MFFFQNALLIFLLGFNKANILDDNILFDNCWKKMSTRYQLFKQNKYQLSMQSG